MKTNYSVSKLEIEKAHEIVKDFCHNTPILTSTSINEMLGCNLYFKCENFQKVGLI